MEETDGDILKECVAVGDADVVAEGVRDTSGERLGVNVRDCVPAADTESCVTLCDDVLDAGAETLEVCDAVRDCEWLPSVEALGVAEPNVRLTLLALLGETVVDCALDSEQLDE